MGAHDAVAAPLPVARRRGSMMPYYAYRAGEGLVRALPRRTCYWLGDRAADVLLLTVPQKFQPLRDNLRHVLPHASPRQLRRVVRRNLRNLTHCWIDVMEMSSRGHEFPSRLDIVDLPNFTDAYERGRGVVVASLHYGSWEAGLAAWNAMGGRMALLAEVLRPPQLFERVVGSRGKLGVQVIPIDVAAMRSGDPEVARRVGAGAMREVFRILRSGGTIAMALDRDLIGNGEPIQFFGKPAPIPVGVVDIAMRTGAAIVPVALFRDDRRVRGVPYPEVDYDPDAPRQEEVRRVTRHILALFETVIREHPDQWHVLEPIWSAEQA
jgi:phosphatidylinositol dimannoside acyltransferase